MMLVFISASLWGCLGCELFDRHIIGQMQRVISCHFHMTRDMHELVANITRTQALTCVLKAVSATCWGSLFDL